MLSRFSAFVVYLVAGLVVSAVASPMGQSDGYGGVVKQLSKYDSDPEHPYPSKYYSAREVKGEDKHYKGKEYEHYKNNSRKGHCNVGKQLCCNSVTKADDEGTLNLLALLGVATVVDATTLTGTDCSGSVGTGASCKTAPVCCENTKFGGFLALGCNSINVF